MLYSSSKEVCVPDCISRFLGWGPRAGLRASRHCPWLFSRTPGLSAMTWGPPAPDCLAMMGWGPRWPSSDLASLLPACLGPNGEPVEVSVGPSGAGGFSQPWRLTGQAGGGLGVPGKTQDPHAQPWGRRAPSSPGPLPSHGVQDRVLPPGPRGPQPHPHLWRAPQAPSRGFLPLRPWPWAPLSSPPTAWPHSQRGLP